jgi:hypothetical protein
VNALAARLSFTRVRAIEEVADTVAKWDLEVPDDPGVTELADLLSEAAANLPEDFDGRSAATAHRTVAVEHLRAAARLGGLLPVVACAHLRLALHQKRSAHLAPDPDGSPNGVTGSHSPRKER